MPVQMTVSGWTAVLNRSLFSCCQPAAWVTAANDTLRKFPGAVARVRNCVPAGPRRMTGVDPLQPSAAMWQPASLQL